MRGFTPVFTVGLILTSAAIADDRIDLKSGDTLIGSIVEVTDEHVIIEHPALGTITVPRAEILAMPDHDELPMLPVVEQEPEAPKWESQFDLGFAGSTGNTESLDLRIGFRSQHETETDRWRFDAAYFYGQTDNNTTKNQATAGVLKDWLMPDSPWLFFAQGRYDFDRFRDWTHRASGHGGLGYEFVKTEEFTLIGRLGAGAAKEWRRAQPLRPEGLIGGELSWRINEQQRLIAHTTLYPDLGDFFEFRVVSGVAWNLAIDRARGVSLNLGIDNEYQSSTEGDVQHNDLRFYGGISIAF